MVFLLVYVFAPLVVATYLTVAFRRGGGWRLWRDTVLLTAALAGFSLWQPGIEFHHYSPLSGNGVDTWPFFPVAALVAAAVVHALSSLEVPVAFRVAPAALFASVTIRIGFWIV